MAALVHPAEIANLHAGVAQPDDLRARRRFGQQPLDAAQGFHAQRLGAHQVLFHADADIEFEAPAGVARVVERDATEHHRIGQAQVVAVERHQDGRARGQRDDHAFVAVDHHVVARRKRLAQAHQQPGQVIFQDVLEGEAKRHAQHAGGAQHRAHQGGGVEEFQGHQQAGQHHHPAHGGAREVLHERVAARDAAHQLAARQPAAQQPGQQHHHQGHCQQRQVAEQGIHFLCQSFQAGGDLAGTGFNGHAVS